MKKVKPNRDFFEYVLQDSGIQANESLFIDDGVKNIQTAEDMGFLTLHVQNGEDWRGKVKQCLSV
jgi:putative hydrolase of the HAD superfamily